ncbi:MAG: hypothetical protein KF845_09915 [Cyclobacteriaceae bacterium]|nr:hypothetical protein [Cyclobacteriaceae bacterium]
MTVLIVVSIVFAAFCFGKVLLTKDKDKKLVFILATLCFVTIAAKIDYVYYNRFVSFALLLTIAYLLAKKNFNRLDKGTILGVSILTLVVVLIPDKQIMSYKYYGLRTNGEQVTWDDFKAIPSREKGNSARIRANLLYEINEAFDYPPAIVLSYVDPYKSWVKDRTDEPMFDLLLAHEQGHFYIAEYYARLANDSLRTTWARREKTAYIINAFYAKTDSLHILYDSLTNHGVLVDKQFEWTKYLKSKLRIPSLPTDIENIPYNLNRDTTNAR